MKYYTVVFAIEDDDVAILEDAEITARYVKNGTIRHEKLFFPLRSTNEVQDLFKITKDYVKSIERFQENNKGESQ